MKQSTAEIAGLRTLIVDSGTTARIVPVMLHGHAMLPEALAPFAASISLPARFYLPAGPVPASVGGRSWWLIDEAARARTLGRGPRDLAGEHPPGLPNARRHLMDFLAEIGTLSPALPIVLVGFSQGGMLACDTALRERVPVSGLALLSASRIAADEWEPLGHKLHGLPVLVSHGERDSDLAFSAGKRLRDFLLRFGAHVTWVPFAEGHEIPLVVWRSLKKFLMGLSAASERAS